MANEFCARFTPAEGSATVRGLPLGTMNNYHNGLLSVGSGVGSAFPHGQTGAVLFLIRVPNAVALATGLSFSYAVADDPLAPAGGLVGVFGITVGPVTSGTTLYDETILASSTEVTKSTTMAATIGAITVDAIAVPIASMNSLAAGGWALVRFRRLGANASDTDLARVMLLGIDCRNT